MPGKNLLRFCLFLLLLLVFSGCQPTRLSTPGYVEATPQPADRHPAATVPPLTETAASPPVPLRQAIAYCTDRSALIRSVYPWVADAGRFEANSFLLPSQSRYIDGDMDVPRYPYSPETGMALLDTIGWKLANGAAFRTNANGETLTLTLTTTEAKFRETWTAVWEEQMKNCGIHITRKFTTAEWLFGSETGLPRRDFELAAFSRCSSARFLRSKTARLLKNG